MSTKRQILYGRKYRLENQELLREKRHQKYLKQMKNANLLEQKRKYAREYYKKYRNNPEYQKYRKEYWSRISSNPELYSRRKDAVNRWRGTISGIYTSLKNRRRNDFRITKKEFVEWYEKQEKKCSYCGITLEEIKRLPYPYNRKNGLVKLSIDRKDNSAGYKIDNITLSCFTCNTIKNNFFTYDEMRKIGQKIISPKLKRLLKESSVEYVKNQGPQT